MSEFTRFDEYPKVKYMPAGSSVNVVVGNSMRMITENVDEVIEAVKEYQRAYENACELSSWDNIYEVCLTAGVDCICLEDAYDNLISAMSPYERFNLQGIIDKDSEGQYFLGGYSTPIPEILAELILEYEDNGLDTDPLVKFWEKALLNPNDQAREDLMQYITDYGIVITDEGYMLLYKYVVDKEIADPDEDLVSFVSTEYVRRKGWGKNPSDYFVYNFDLPVTLPNNHEVDEGLYVSKMPLDDMEVKCDVGEEEYVGNLQELYDDLENLKGDTSTTVYTDWYSGTMNYELGETHSVPREECDPDISRGCSTGLHVGSYDYVSGFAPMGATVQACLVSPTDVVAIPKHDNSKIRTCKFHSLGLMDTSEENWELEGSYFEESFTEYTEDDLNSMLDDLHNRSLFEDSDLVEDQIEVVEQRLIEL